MRRLSENPKIGAVDEAEIVCDSVAETVPVSGHFVSQERDDLSLELAESLVIPVVGDVFVHQGPQPFDGIEMGTVGRKEVQHDFAPGLGKPLFDDVGLVIAGVVDEDVDEAHRGMRAFDLAQQLDEAQRVDCLDGENLRLAGFQIDGAVDIEPVTARRLLHREGDVPAGPAAGLTWWVG